MRFVETILTLIGILLMLGGCSATGVTMMPMTVIARSSWVGSSYCTP